MPVAHEGRACASGPLWERALPAKGSEAPGRIPETWFFGCSVLRIRDAVQWRCLPGPLKSSLIAVSLAVPGQTAPSRHHHCPAHWAASPPRDITPPGPLQKGSASAMTRGTGVCPGASLCSALPGPWRTGRSTGSVQGRIHSVPGRAEHRHATPDGGRELPEKSLWNPAGWLAPPFRGLGPLPQIAPTKLATGVRRRSAGRPPARRRRGG